MDGGCTRRSSFLQLRNTLNGLGLAIGVVLSTTDCTSISIEKAGAVPKVTASCQGYELNIF
jgi:hypothetical protein